MAITIVQRKLTESEITELVENVRLFPNLAYVSPSRWRHFTNPYCILVDGYFAGVCAIYSFKNWVKLGPLVILKKHQGKGLGKKLLHKIIHDHNDRSIFIASSNPVVQYIVTCFDFQQISSFFSLPKDVQLFLIRQLVEHLNIAFITESIRKKLFLRRSGIKFFGKSFRLSSDPLSTSV